MVLSFAGGFSPLLSVVSLLFSVSYPQARRSYYLFFNYLFLLLVCVTRICGNEGGGVTRICGNELKTCYPYMRGKLTRITQACGNKCFTGF